MGSITIQSAFRRKICCDASPHSNSHHQGDTVCLVGNLRFTLPRLHPARDDNI